MKTKKYQQGFIKKGSAIAAGFAHIELLFLIILAAGLTFSTLYVVGHHGNGTAASIPFFTRKKVDPYAGWVTHSGPIYSLKYPSGWKFYGVGEQMPAKAEDGSAITTTVVYDTLVASGQAAGDKTMTVVWTDSQLPAKSYLNDLNVPTGEILDLKSLKINGKEAATETIRMSSGAEIRKTAISNGSKVLRLDYSYGINGKTVDKIIQSVVLP
jgi:hypothetical protein